MNHEWVQVVQQPIRVTAAGTDELITEPTGAGLTAQGCGICGKALDPDTFLTECTATTPIDARELFEMRR